MRKIALSFVVVGLLVAAGCGGKPTFKEFRDKLTATHSYPHMSQKALFELVGKPHHQRIGIDVYYLYYAVKEGTAVVTVENGSARGDFSLVGVRNIQLEY